MRNARDYGLAIDVARMRVLDAVIEAGSVTSAARLLGVTPSAVSQQLAALEREVGVELAERTSTGVVPTAAGELLVARARQIADLLADAHAQLQSGAGSATGRVAIAAVASACASFVSAAVTDLRVSHPDLRLVVQSSEPMDSIAAVSTGRVEVAVVDEYDHVPLALPDDLDTQTVCTDRLVALVPADWTGPTSAVWLTSLRTEQWVMPPVSAACGQAVRTACRAAGFEPDVRWETDDMLALERMVAHGHGVAVLPSLAIHEPSAVARVVPLIRPAMSRRLITVVRRSAAARPSVRTVLDAIARQARSTQPRSA